jgi:predicted nucleic acid-binding protein
MTARCFLDSNAWIYFFKDEDPVKQNTARMFVTKTHNEGVLVASWQILNEVWRNLLRKNVSEPVAREMVESIYNSCEMEGFSFDLLVLAHELRQKHTVSYWDSLIVASALAADCDFLISEDMQDGRRFGKMKIRNIFQNQI